VISQLPFHYTGKGLDAVDGFPLRVVEGGHEVGIGSIGLRLNRLSAQYIRAVAAQGIDVVVDFVLLSEEVLTPYVEELANQSLIFVGVDCDPIELARRNSNRRDRASGLSVLQQQSIHFCRARYDLELDSTDCEAKEMAKAVMSHLSRNSPTYGFM